jgi:hypothetical protein
MDYQILVDRIRQDEFDATLGLLKEIEDIPSHVMPMMFDYKRECLDEDGISVQTVKKDYKESISDPRRIAARFEILQRNAAMKNRKKS